MKLAIKELAHNKKKYILIELIIVLLMFMVLFLSGLVNGLGRAVSASIEMMNAKYFVLSDSAEDIITVSNIDMNQYMNIKDELSDEITGLNVQRMFLQLPDSEEKLNVTYFAIDENSFIAPSVFEGKNLAKSDVQNPIVLDDDFMLQDIKVGDTVIDSATDMEFTVVGFSKDQMYGHTSVAFITNTDYFKLRRAISPVYEKSYNALVTNNDKIHDLELDGLVVDDKQTVIESIPSYSAEHTTITMVIWLLVFISAIIIGVFFYILTIQKERQFAVMKSLGVSMKQIATMIVSQVCIIAMFGAIVTNILNTSMALALPQTMPYYLQIPDAIGVSVVFVAISVISSLLSVLRVSKVDPMTVIGGNNNE